MPYNYPTPLIDPFFSQKLLTTKPTQQLFELEEQLHQKIEKLYESLSVKSAIYYEGSASGAALTAFAQSNTFDHLIAQLEVCITQLKIFCDTQSITILHSANLESGASLLTTFFEKLKTDYFSDRRALLYSYGKKYLETIAIFINEEKIDLAFRMIQINQLLSDQGLTQSCAEGCFTRLQNAAENFKNYGIFEVPVLFKRYIQRIVDDIIHRPIYLGGIENIAKKIAKLMKFSPEAFEIHGRNYALKTFKESFNLDLIELVEDNYIQRIELFLSQHSEEKIALESDFHYLYHYLRQEATTAGWIQYLSEEISSSIPKKADYMTRIEFLEKTALQTIGSDPQFSLREVLEEETGSVKPNKYLTITLMERLLNSGWLELNLAKLLIKDSLFLCRNKVWSSSLPFQPFTENYKIFYNNLELSWLKVGEERLLLIDLLNHKEGIQRIKALHSDQAVLLNNLLQTPKDLITFLSYIELSSPDTVINWLKFDETVITKALSYYQSESTTALLEPILYVAGNLDKKSRSFFLDRIVNFKTLRELLQDKIRILSSLVANNNAADIINALIRKSISIGAEDFSQFVFYKNKQHVGKNNYLSQINFSMSEWTMTQFKEGVYSCHFYKMRLKDNFFDSHLVFSRFVETIIEDSFFYDSVIRCSFYLAHLNNLSFYQDVLNTNFDDSILVKLEFRNVIQNCFFKKSRMLINQFLDIVSSANFNMAHMENVLFNKIIMNSNFNFAHLEVVSFRGEISKCSFASAYFIKINFHNSMIESNCKLVDLDEVNFYKEVNQVNFDAAQFRCVNFQDKMFKCIFNRAKQTDVVFFKAIIESPFIGATLNKVTFRDKVEHCDFTTAYLDEVHFLGMLAQIKFNESVLKKSSFLGNIYRSDFSGTTVQESKLEDLVIKNTKFNKVDISEVDFSGTFFNKVKFSQTNLEKISFRKSIFEQVNFNHCELSYVSFRNANFNQKVEFKSTSFKNVDFGYCNLSYVKFELVFMKKINLKKAIINVEQLFDIFYYHNIHDFSDVFLSNPEMVSERFLSVYGQRTLRNVILSESLFLGLIALGFKNFQETNLSYLTKDQFISFYHSPDYNFENIILPRNWNEQEPIISHSTENTEEISDIGHCLSEKRRRRQETRCLIDWQDVDRFNREKEYSRVIQKISIDQAAFTAVLRQTVSLQKRKQLMQLAQFVTSESNELPSLVYWRNAQKIKQHFTYVDKLLKGVSQGLIYEEIFQELIRGDYKHVCLNFGVIGGSIVSSKFAKALVKRGEKLTLANKVILGRTLKIMAPFVRGTPISAYLIYDLIQQAEALKAGDLEALVSLISDGLFIGIETAEMGIEITEMMGLIVDVSSFTGPLGETLAALIFLGTQGYFAAKKVWKIENLISLSNWQVFVEGLYAFLGIDPPIHIQSLLQLDQAYTAYKENIYRFLEANPKVKHYIVPSIDIQFDQKSKSLLNDSVLNVSPSLVKTSVYADENSFVWLVKEPQVGWLFNDMNPLKNHINHQDLFCNPYKINLDENRTRICDRALVIKNPWAEQEGTYTLWRLGEGDDSGYSYLPDINTFIVNEGYKIYKGSNQSDIFILDGSLILGFLDADQGVDTLDLNYYAPSQKNIMIDCYEGTLLYNDTAPLYLRRFERILGRTKKWDTLLVSSEVEFIDLRGGDKPYFDEIKIPERLSPKTKIEMMVWPETIVNNKATQGSFDYILSVDRQSYTSTQIEGWSILLFSENKTSSQNRFFFQCYFHELNAIQMSPSEVELTFYFSLKNASVSNFKTTIVYPPLQAEYIFMDHTQIQIGEEDHFYAFHQSNQSVSQLITTYRPVAQRLNMTLVLYQALENEIIVIGRSLPEVFFNDVNTTKTHLVGNGSNNTYVIAGNTDLNTNRAYEVVLYDFAEPGHQTLDLRLLNKQFPGGVLENPELSVMLMKIADDLQLFIYRTAEQKEFSSLRITFRNGLNWYQRLSILCNHVPLHLVQSAETVWRLQPLPLYFNAQQNILIITPHDVERENKIVLDRKEGQYQFYRDASDLWLTNWFNYPQNKTELYSLLFKEFYLHDKMRTLTLTFSDATLKIIDLKDAIDNAANLNERLIALEQATWQVLLSSPESALTSHNQTKSSTRRRRVANQPSRSEKETQVDSTVSSRQRNAQSFWAQQIAAHADQTTRFIIEEQKKSTQASLSLFFSTLRKRNSFLPNNMIAVNDTFNKTSCESLSTSQRITHETFDLKNTMTYPSVPIIDILELLNFWVRRYCFSSNNSKSNCSVEKSALKNRT